MSGRGVITSRGHGVAEVDDGVDEGALVLLDHLLLVRHVGHGLELGVGDVGVRHALLPSSLAPMIRLASPIRTDESQRMGGNRIRVLTMRRAEQRRPVGVLHRPVLGHRLEEHEDHHDLEHDAEEHAEAAEEVLGDDADQGGRDQLADQHEQQDRVEEVGRVLDQAGQLSRPALCARRPATWP